MRNDLFVKANRDRSEINMPSVRGREYIDNLGISRVDIKRTCDKCSKRELFF